MENEHIRNEHIEIIFYLFIVGISIILPILGGLILRGFEESFVSGQALEFGTYLSSFLTYIPFIIVSILVIIFPIAKLLMFRKGEHPAVSKGKTLPKGWNWAKIFTISYLFAQEENGFLYFLSNQTGSTKKKNWMRWSLNPIRLIVASLILFGIYGIVVVTNPQYAVSGVPSLVAQQVTLTTEVIFNAIVPSLGENMLVLFIFMLLMGINAFLVQKTNLSKVNKLWTFYAVGFFICILTGLLFGGLHTIIYGNEDVKFLATIVLGTLGSIFTLLFGTFIVWFIWHIMNNLFVTLREIIVIKEDVIIITIISIVILAGLWIGIELLNKKLKKY